ncbi:MAG TPA: DUF6174 domain-containing protein [Gemmatimonadota bacterium]|nr:DUF6174 domain-containing protein [Gemmatimonadota bacterium]
MDARPLLRRAAAAAALAALSGASVPARAQDRPVGPTASVSVSTAPSVRLEVAPEPIPVGGTGTLGVRVTGLGDIAGRRVVRLVNASPEVVRLEGGPEVVLVIEPGDVRADGSWSTDLALTALGPGAWRIRVAGPATVAGDAPVVGYRPPSEPPFTPPPGVPRVVDPPSGVPRPVDPPPAAPTPGAEPWRPRAALAVARGRWAEAGISDYEFVVERVCFCPPEWRGPVRVEVRNGVVVRRTYVEDGRPVAGDRVDMFPGVEGIFEFVEEALDENPHRIDAQYDRVTGRPLRVWVDYDERMADEERGFTTSDLVVTG